MPSVEEGVCLIPCLLRSCEGHVKERESEERDVTSFAPSAAAY